MAFTMLETTSVLLPSSAGALENYSAKTSVKIRLTNTSGSTVTGVYLYADYNGTSTGAVDTLVSNLSLAAGESVVVDGGPFTFSSGGRLSGVAGTNNVVTCHISGATY